MNALLHTMLTCLMLFPIWPLDATPKLKKNKQQSAPTLRLLKPTVKEIDHKPPPSPLTHVHTPNIILDPGHGGDDQGAKSLVKPVYSEKNFNLVTARFTQQQLTQKGYSPLLTREKDFFVSLMDRAAMPQLRNKDIFVSIHFNAAASPQAEGIEVFYYRDENHLARTQASKSLAESVLKYIVKETNAKSRGVKHGNYHVIRETDVPAILIEGGFLTHPEELAKIKDPTYLKKLAWGITQGIDHYLKSRE